VNEESDAAPLALPVQAPVPNVVLTTQVPRPPVWLMLAGGLWLLSTVIGALSVASLALHHPLWLIALNAWPRHLLLVAPYAPPVPFVAVATLRGLMTCFVVYEFARHYGARAGEYME
jgi:hypothetical protein